LTNVVKEAASNEHQKLVKALIDKFIESKLEIRQAAYEGYEEPDKVGRHAPDIRAYKPEEELNIIGEAKICEDLKSERSKEQFQDFSSRQMTKGKSEGKAVPFHIITPKACEDELNLVLLELGLSDKPNIIRWSFVSTS